MQWVFLFPNIEFRPRKRPALPMQKSLVEWAVYFKSVGDY
jgi:hypothetical protein